MADYFDPNKTALDNINNLQNNNQQNNIQQPDNNDPQQNNNRQPNLGPQPQ